jgi:hypothetical protein
MGLHEFAWAHNSWMSSLSTSLNFFAGALIIGPIGTWTRSFEAEPWSPSLFNRDSTIQSASRRFCTNYKSENLIPCQPFGRRDIPSGGPTVQSISRPDDVTYRPEAQLSKASTVRTTWHTVRTSNCPKHHPSRRREPSVRTFPCVEKLQTVPACIRPDVSAARPDDSQCSTSFRISFQNTVMWRSLQLSGRRGFPSIRQVSHSKSRRPDASQHGSGARASDMKNACIRYGKCVHQINR